MQNFANDVIEIIDFGDKLKNLNKKVASNKIKNVETVKQLTDLTNKVVQISKKGYDFLLGRMYFTGDNDYQILQFFPKCLIH